MFYYVLTKEQIYNDNGTLSEYATKSDPTTEKQATTAYYNKLGAVNADLGPKGHSFMSIKLENSLGGIEKEDSLGAYIDM